MDGYEWSGVWTDRCAALWLEEEWRSVARKRTNGDCCGGMLGGAARKKVVSGFVFGRRVTVRLLPSQAV